MKMYLIKVSKQTLHESFYYSICVKVVIVKIKVFYPVDDVDSRTDFPSSYTVRSSVIV